MPTAGAVADLIRGLPGLALQAMLRAGHDYAGNKIGSAGGGTVAQGSDGIVGQRFRGAGNARFAPLSSQYAAWKAKRFGKKPVLVRTGGLRESIVGHGRVRLVGTLVEIVFTVPSYGRYHQEGAGDLPRRSPVDPNEADMAAVRKSAQRHYDLLVKAAAAKNGVTIT